MMSSLQHLSFRAGLSSRSAQSSRATRGICTCLFVLAAAACTSREEAARSDTLPAVDTLKAARDTLPTAPDSVAGATTSALKTGAPLSKTSTKTTPPTTPAGTKTKDSIIGFDRTKPLDPRRKQLDTVRRPPQ